MTTDQGISEIVSANNKFALELFQNIKEDGKNVFFSPYSISEALAMTMEGAREKTAKEMEKVLGFPLDGAFRRAGFLALDELLRPKTATYSLNIANALWVQDGMRILQEFHSNVQNFFKGEAKAVDFVKASEQARLTINAWVKERTNGKIIDPIAPNVLSKETLLVLANAIYFKGDWLKEFDKKETKEKEFYVNRKITVKVKMMSHTDDTYFNYYQHKKFQLVELPYKGEELSLLILLPNDDDTKWLEKHMSLKDLNEWRADMKSEEVGVFLPQFRLNCGYKLASTLQHMGMKDIFNRKKADLSGIDGAKDLFVGEVIHQAFLDVNEVGTEAAAVTIVGLCGAGPPPKPIVYCDHPFLFIIQHRKTGNILFLGRLMNPSE